MKAIGDGTFEFHDHLAVLELPEGLETIGERAFANCANLEDLTLPESVTSIDDGAFEGLTVLKKFAILCDASLLPKVPLRLHGHEYGPAGQRNQRIAAVPDGRTAAGAGSAAECAGSSGGERLEVRLRCDGHRQVLPRMRREAPGRRAGLSLRQVRLAARRPGASAEILPRMRRPL